MFKGNRICAMTICLLGLAQNVWAGKNEVLAEVRFKPVSKVEKSAGVWVDGQYLGFVKELKGSKKLMLLPGTHDIVIKSVGFDNFEKELTLEPGETTELLVAMKQSRNVEYPTETAKVRINVEPPRAAVFVDSKYVGYVDRFDGRNQGLLVAPGKHTFKVTLPGYQTFETEMTVNADQHYEISTTLRRGTIIEPDGLTQTEAASETIADSNR